MPDGDAQIETLAGALVDGSAVDWQAAESGASTPSQRAIVRNLRVLASVANVHAAGESGWGHFRIIEQIGHGAFGDVYRAWDSSLDREVALKLLRRREVGTAASTVIEEGRMLARVRHPNVVTVYGADRRDGCVGLWMEFIRGKTLEQIVKHEGPFGAPEAALIGTAVCQAVSAVHAAGLLHRDIKTHNVMREHGGRIVLMDFGVGHDSAADATAGTGLAGTPLYLAPEVLAGGAAAPATDIYSVGVLLFHLVTGDYPVKGNGVSAILALHEQGARQHLRDARPNLPGRFIAIVERALAPDPHERYRTIGEMETALIACLDGRPEDATGGHLVGRLLPAALVVLLSGFAGSRVISPLREPTAPRFAALAVLPFQDVSSLRDAGELADAVTDTLIGELARLRPLRVVSRTSSASYRNTPKLAKVVGHELGVDVLVEGSVRRVEDRYQLDVRLVDTTSDTTVWTERFEGPRNALPFLQGAMSGAIAYELRATLPATARMNRSVDEQAYLAHVKGRALLSKRTPEDMQRARALFERAIDIDPTYAPSHAGLADAYSLLGAFGVLPKSQTLPRAKAAAIKALELDSSLADAHVALSYPLVDEGDRFGAQQALKTAIELSPNHAGARHWNALILVGNGRFNEAVAEIERARLLDPLSMIIAADAGLVYRQAGQLGRAVELLEQTTSLHPQFAEGHLQLALSYEGQGRYEECHAELERARVLSPNNTPVLEHLAWAAAKTNRQEEARALLARLQEPARADTVSSSSLAAVFVALGRLDDAFRYIEKGPDDPLAWAATFAAKPEGYPRLEALTRDPRFTEFQRRALALRQPDGWPTLPQEAKTGRR